MSVRAPHSSAGEPSLRVESALPEKTDGTLERLKDLIEEFIQEGYARALQERQPR